MATIIRRGGKWQAQICVDGVRKAKTFRFKNEAREWANRAELEEQRPASIGGKMPLLELFRRFDEAEGGRILRWYSCRVADYPLGSMELRRIRSGDVEAFLTARAGQIRPGTARRVLAAWSAAFRWAVRQGWMSENPCAGAFGKIPTPAPRDRVPTLEEYALLCRASGWSDGQVPRRSGQRTIAAFRLAMLTGMRGGEILAIEPGWINGNVLHLPAFSTKSRRARDVALSQRARALIDVVMSLGYRPKIFGLSSQQKVQNFIRIRNRAGLGEVRDPEGRIIREALHFHDSRAYFCSWAGSKNSQGETRLTPLELARQLGHSDLKMVMRYFRASLADIAGRLDG